MVLNGLQKEKEKEKERVGRWKGMCWEDVWGGKRREGMGVAKVDCMPV